LHLITFLISYPFIKIISILPFRLVYILSDFVYIIIYKLIKYRVKLVRSNLELAFPEYSSSKRLIIESNFYRHFCDIMLEAFKSIGMTKKQILERYEFKNQSIVYDLLKKNKSIVLLMGHYSNFEWAMSVGHYLDNVKGVGAYTPLTNKYFEKLMLKVRKRHKGYLVSRYKIHDYIKSEEEKNNLNIYGFATDQSPRPTDKTYWRKFLNVNVPFFTGGERIANKYDYSIVFGLAKRVKRGYYTFKTFRTTKKTDHPYDITNQFVEFIEKQIREHPSEYLWTHNRFKHKDLYGEFK